jgi:AraC family transcriptional regulator
MKPSTRSVYDLAVRRVIDYLLLHLDEAVDLAALASLACLSPFHFHRIFRGMVGETPLELVRRVRMERAAWRLGRTDTPVTMLVFEAGYETHEAFARAFRSSYGTSPTEFRRNGIKRAELAASCGVHFQADGAFMDFTPRNTGGSTMHVDIEQLAEKRLGAIRHMGPYNQIGRAFERLGSVAGPAGLFQDPAAAMIAIYYDDPESTPPEALRSDAGIAVSEGRALPAGLSEVRLPAGRYARTTHIGPFDTLGDTWMRFMGEWLPASGHQVADGPAFELYVSDMRTTPKEELRTDIYVPIV